MVTKPRGRPRPLGRLVLIGGLAAAALVAGAVAVALLRGGVETFAAHAVSFRYPSGWGPVPEASFRSSGRELTRDVLGIDGDNAVLIATYRLNAEVTATSYAALRPEIVESIQQLVSDAGGRVLRGPEDLTVDGMPALRFELALPSPDGAPLASRLVVAFRGATEYWLNCRHDAEHAQELLEGCDLIVRTFEAA